MSQKFSMENTDAFCVVADTPERKEHFLILKEAIPQLEKFPAIMGESLKKVELKHLIKNKTLGVRSVCFLNCGEIGLYLSQLQILNNFIKSKKEYCLILEDDMCLKDNFENNVKEALSECPLDWDLLYLYLNPFQRGQLPIPIEGKKYILKAVPIWCTCAYMVTQKGAQKIVNNIQPMKKALDVHFEELIINKLLTAFVIKKEITTCSGPSYRGHIGKIPGIIDNSNYVRNFFWRQILLRFLYFLYLFLFIIPVWFFNGSGKWMSLQYGVTYGFRTYPNAVRRIRSLRRFVDRNIRKWTKGTSKNLRL